VRKIHLRCICRLNACARIYVYVGSFVGIAVAVVANTCCKFTGME